MVISWRVTSKSKSLGLGYDGHKDKSMDKSAAKFVWLIEYNKI